MSGVDEIIKLAWACVNTEHRLQLMRAASEYVAIMGLKGPGGQSCEEWHLQQRLYGEVGREWSFRRGLEGHGSKKLCSGLLSNEPSGLPVFENLRSMSQ